ncbi:hypothetical protein V6N13_037830 [Hibiscus sabdariffa]
MGLATDIAGIIGNIISLGIFLLPAAIVENISVFVAIIVSLYLNVYVPFAIDPKKRLFGRIVLFEMVLTIVIILVAMICFCSSRRVVFVGIIADASSIIVYASHVAIWKKVITTKSVEYMHFWLSLAALSNGICWTIFALLQFDIFVLVSSGVRAIFRAIELSLYAYFYFNGKKKVRPSEESSDVHPSEAA